MISREVSRVATDTRYRYWVSFGDFLKISSHDGITGKDLKIRAATDEHPEPFSRLDTEHAVDFTLARVEPDYAEGSDVEGNIDDLNQLVRDAHQDFLKACYGAGVQIKNSQPDNG